jgi:hypothetical protein
MDMVSCMSEGVGLVHQMPFACDRTGIPATLEKVKHRFNVLTSFQSLEHLKNHYHVSILGGCF